MGVLSVRVVVKVSLLPARILLESFHNPSRLILETIALRHDICNICHYTTRNIYQARL